MSPALLKQPGSLLFCNVRFWPIAASLGAVASQIPFCNYPSSANIKSVIRPK